MGKDKRRRGETARAEEHGAKAPRKALYRARAHANPLNAAFFGDPMCPQDMNWRDMYQEAFAEAEAAGVPPPQVRFADVGCGFGGLIVSLSPLYPDKLMVGMELRDKVTEYVKERTRALRQAHPGQYTNISALRTNAMKALPNYFRKGQLEKLFFLFPDPHFKVANHRRRIIQSTLLAEYAHFLAVGGMLYTITDVEELGVWMREKLEAHPLFERVGEEELDSDPAACLLVSATEEGQKVARNGGKTWRSVFRRIEGPADSKPASEPGPAC